MVLESLVEIALDSPDRTDFLETKNYINDVYGTLVIRQYDIHDNPTTESQCSVALLLPDLTH